MLYKKLKTLALNVHKDEKCKSLALPTKVNNTKPIILYCKIHLFSPVWYGYCIVNFTISLFKNAKFQICEN